MCKISPQPARKAPLRFCGALAMLTVFKGAVLGAPATGIGPSSAETLGSGAGACAKRQVQGGQAGVLAGASAKLFCGVDASMRDMLLSGPMAGLGVRCRGVLCVPTAG